MCRFALIRSSKLINPQPILEKFGIMAKNSPAFDGDWQGDGWGISYLNKNNDWEVKKSLNPIWEDKNLFDQFPRTNIFVIHARSASFEHHKGEIDYNQPYINKPYAFVFNGLLKKVHFQQPIPGKIGSQKLFHLLNQLLKNQVTTNINNNRNDVILNILTIFEQLLRANVEKIQACNIGLANHSNIYALNLFSKHPKYYRLHYLDSPNLKIICSCPLGGMNLTPLKSKTISL